MLWKENFYNTRKTGGGNTPPVGFRYLLNMGLILLR